MSDRDFGELVWENGQILTRVLSSTGSHENRRWSSFSLHDSKAQVEVGWDTSMVKRGRLLDKEFPGHTKMDPHPNYTRQDSLKKDCHTELLAKFSGSILNDEVAYTISGHDEQLVPSADNQNFKQGNACNLFSGEPQLTRPKGGQICESSLQQGQASSPYIRSRDGSSKIPVSTSGLSNSMMRQPEQEQDADPDNRMGSMNFSYFLKLAALDKAKAQNIDAARATTSPGLSRLTESKSDYANGTNPFRLRPIGPPTGSVTPKLLPQPVASSLREPLSNGHCKAVGHEVAFGNTASANQIPKPNSSFAASIVKGKKGKPYAEKSVEPLLASSSTCSREASNYPSYSLKSKCQESEESEHPSQSFEEEPRRAEGAMSTRGGSAGSKRNRSAEGHSLSEKRRRDRINKKMRSLQELIPNCKKVDKISILDEAIDYLKTLQLQVQVMSMGAGMCMAPVMIPAVLQQIQAAHLPHFSPMGMGMGIRMGMGMGMGMGLGLGLGLGCNPEQFPSPPILGAAALSGIAGTAPQMLGHPGQVLPMSLSSAPFIPLHAGSLTQSVLVPSVPKDIHPVGHPGSSPSSN